MTAENAPPLALVVDDDPLFRTATVAALTRFGLRVVEASDGDEGLERFAARPADVILLDAQMPRLDGFETCARLRDMPGGAAVPVLMLTALDDEESIKSAYVAGATDFHSKPPRWSILGQRVRFMIRAAKMRKDLARTQAEAARTERIARLGQWEWDLPQGRMSLSAECARLLGFAPRALAMTPAEFFAAFAEADRGRLAALANPAPASGTEEGTFDFECLVPVRPVARVVRVEAALVRAADGRVIRVNAVLQDVTERKHAEERIEHLAHFDPVTGFANRARFRDLVAEATAAGEGAAVLFVQPRRLASVTQALGRDAAEALTREAGVRLATALAWTLERFPGVHGDFGRPGGGAFGVLLTGPVDDELALVLGEALARSLDSPLVVEGREIFARASAGYALAPQDGRDADDLLRQADRSLQAALRGRPGEVAAPARQEKAAPVPVHDLALETDLHYALKRGELRLHYQPQIDARTGRISGVEALMRWYRQGEMVPPGRFITLAEETGLIEPIEDWAIGESCRQYARWREAGAGAIPVAVNLTASHFLNPELPGIVARALAETGVPPAHLELEITESVLLEDLPRAVARMEALNELGVRVAIDDFGTGYSSLQYLRRLPIDRLKIDRAFVSDLGSSPSAEALLAAMLAMTKALGLRVIVEGIETRAQAETLFANGCSQMQGFYFAKPLEADGVLALANGPRRADWKFGAGPAPREALSHAG
ncbi:MAG: EAL domain-containing protein [Betaproteobacteria bacterium]|nr:EAL domain-containing protein [Betaproteobacteria bacterium]